MFSFNSCDKCNAPTGWRRIANPTANDLRTLRNHFASNRRPVADVAPIDHRLIADQSQIGLHGVAKSPHLCVDESNRRTDGNQSAMKIRLLGNLSETNKTSKRQLTNTDQHLRPPHNKPQMNMSCYNVITDCTWYLFSMNNAPSIAQYTNRVLFCFFQSLVQGMIIIFRQCCHNINDGIYWPVLANYRILQLVIEYTC